MAWETTADGSKIRTTPVCSIDGCGRDSASRGLCVMHYQRLMKHGDVEYVSENYSKNIPVWDRVLKAGYNVDENGCWLWTRAVNRSGYGIIREGTKIWTMHRLSWVHQNGQIPSETPVVRHKCDVRLCFNPEHLELGTPADNSRDMQLRSKHAFAKLTRVEAREIKDKLAAGVGGSALAREYNVSPMTVSDIKRGKTWKHV